MKKDFSHWYKTKFNQLNDAPPDDAWENISNGLDLDEVWKGVNSELNKKDKRKAFARITIPLVLLVSAGSILFYLTNKKGKDNNKTELAQQALANNLKIQKVNTKNITGNETTANDEIFGGISKSTINNKLSEKKTENLTPIGQTKEKLTPVIERKNTANKHLLRSQHLKISNTAEKNLLMTTITLLLVEVNTTDDRFIDSLIHRKLNDSIINNKKIATKADNSLIVGVAFANANTWLLNNDTYSGLRAGTLNQTLFSYGKSYNVLLGYNLSNRYCLQTEWVINNTHKQQYIDYKNGHQVNRNLRIDFTQLTILMKKKNEAYYFSNKLHTSFNYLAGLNYSYVKSFTQQTDEVISSVKDDYKNNQYNLILGLEYQLFITPSWIFSSGIRTNIGLQNIYKGNTYNPSNNSNKTYDSSIGLTVGIAYQIHRKNK
jgi:hypothetical protein